MSSGTDQVIRSAARRLGAQAAALVAVVVLLLTGLAVGITTYTQRSADERLLRDTAAHADDVVDAPAGTWLVLRDHAGHQQNSAGLPAGLPDESGLRAVVRTGTAVQHELDLPAGEYLTYTRARTRGVVQVVLDLAAAHRERRNLLLLLGVGALGGLLLAGGIGALLARKVLAPLRATLTLQQQFVADASHELRTPLTHLHTRAQLLRRALADAPTALRTEADDIVRDSSVLAELVEDLLLAAQPDGQGEPGAGEDVALRPLVHDTVAAARPYAVQRGVHLRTTDSPDPTPSSATTDTDTADTDTAETATVYGSAAALRRALLALLDNAIEHTPAEGTVTVTLRRIGGRVELTVHDTGTGFAPEQGDSLTDRFHSGGHRSDRRHYGLGLALVNDIAHRHGGTLQAGNTEHGAAFTLSLPQRERHSRRTGRTRR